MNIVDLNDAAPSVLDRFIIDQCTHNYDGCGISVKSFNDLLEWSDITDDYTKREFKKSYKDYVKAHYDSRHFFSVNKVEETDTKKPHIVKLEA